jgi:TatD DNase family protein
MLIDTHAHLEMREFSDDREDVIKRAREAGVDYIVTIGTTVESTRDAVMLADKYDFIYAAIGIHPHETKDILHPAYEIIRHFASHKKVVAYGEIGLDYYYEHTQRVVQQPGSWRCRSSSMTGTRTRIHCASCRRNGIPSLAV